jgi:uncharacterized protein YukE
MAVTKEQLLLASDAIGSISEELANVCGKVPSVMQGHNVMSVSGVQEQVNAVTSAITRAIEAANACRSNLRGKAAHLESMGM